MDGTKFDNLIKRFSTTPLTRATVLRGLAATPLAALAGVARGADEDALADGQKKRRHRKKPVCNCTSAQASSCTTQKLGKKARRRLLASNTCAYSGKCTGVSGCAAPGPGPVPGVTCTTNATCAGRQACINGSCAPCTATSQCGAEEACLNGQCIGPRSIPCENAGSDQPCQAVSNLLQCRPVQGGGPSQGSGSEFFCLLGNQCRPVAVNNNACKAAEICLLGECVASCSSAAQCAGNETCAGGYCLDNP
jgi:hypothetical protein